MVPTGQAKQVAEALAQELCEFPQLCLQLDRQSVYNQWGLDLETATAQEFEQGLKALAAGGYSGAAQFAGGVGRHGTFTPTG